MSADIATTERNSSPGGCPGATLENSTISDSAEFFLPSESGFPAKGVSEQFPPAVLGCRYEGEFCGMAYCYTDMEQGSPAYGGTFAVPMKEATPAAALAARDKQRAQFAAAGGCKV